MPSLIPGYEYDLFISYRHKDNLPSYGHDRQLSSDGWVTEFVSNLRKELAAMNEKYGRKRCYKLFRSTKQVTK